MKFYKPQESQEYLIDLFRSVNNKNMILLDPVYRESVVLNNSIKVGQSVYSKRRKDEPAYKNYAVPRIYVNGMQFILDSIIFWWVS